MEKDNWLKYRKIFDCITTDNDDTLSSIMELIPALDKFFSLAPSVIFIIDYSTMQYLYFNGNDFTGNVAEDSLKGGVEFAISNVHPEDIEKLMSQIFPYIKNFLVKLPVETYKDYKFSFNFRYKKRDGSWQHFIQHSTYFPDKPGNLRYNFGMGNNLPDSYENNITLTIEKRTKGGIRTIDIKSITVGSPNIFTKRESEVLALIYQGLISSAIAEKLCLSEHTVKNHRKNMLKKSGTANTAALVSYALENKLI